MSFLETFKALSEKHRGKVAELAGFVARHSGLPGGSALADLLNSVDKIDNQQQLARIEEVLSTVLGQGEALVAAVTEERISVEVLRRDQSALAEDQRQALEDMQRSLRALPDLRDFLDERLDREFGDLRSDLRVLASLLGDRHAELAKRLEGIHSGLELGPRVELSDSFIMQTARQRGLVDEAATAIAALPAELRSEPEVQNELGRLELLRDAPEEAAGHFAAAASAPALEGSEAARQRAEAHFNAFHARLQAGRFAEALESFREAIRLDPELKLFDDEEYPPREILGVGAFGVAFLCDHRWSGDAVVIKTLTGGAGVEPEAVLAEAGLLREIRSPYVARVRRAGWAFQTATERRSPYLVSDFVGRQTLEAFVEAHGAPAWALAGPALLALAEGLAASHGRGILHRDVKPSNVCLREEDGRLVPGLIDFGLGCRSESFAGLHSRVSATRAGSRSAAAASVCGTWDFMSPEARAGSVGFAADIYAFGLTARILLFGTRRPRRGHWRRIPESVRERLQDLLEDCTEEAPGKRPLTMSEVVERLRALMVEAPSSSGGADAGGNALSTTVSPVVAVARPREKAARAGGPRQPRSVSLAPLKQREAWKKLDAAAQDAIARRIETQLADQGHGGWSFAPGETKSWSCGGLTHRICAFRYAKTKAIFHLLPGGSFQMGSAKVDKKGYDFERPQHPVSVPPLLLAQTPLTQAQWLEVDKTNPSHASGKPDHPVENMSHKAAEAWCKAAGLRLPSEAEWEYACRAGTTTRYSFGDDEGELGDYAWYDDDSDNADKTHPVGRKKPNAFGLFEVHGNVWEWCADPWHEDYKGAPKDGSVWSVDGHASYRVYRGGSAWYASWYLRSAFRYRYSDARGHLGFRPAGPRL